MTETQRKLAAEAEAVRGLKVECEDLRKQIDSEREASHKASEERDEAQHKVKELEQMNADEKETALAVEKSLREHYGQLDAEWRKSVLSFILGVPYR